MKFLTKKYLLAAWLGMATVVALQTPVVHAAGEAKMLRGEVKSEEELLHQRSNGEHPDVQAHAVPANKGSWLDNYGPPESFSSYGHELDWLFGYTTSVAFVCFLLIFGALVYFGIVYRARPGHTAHYDHGTSRGSWIFRGVVVLLIFVALDGVLREKSADFAKEVLWKTPDASEAVKIMVMPQQWAWNFRYAGKDGVFNTADDIVTINEMKIPAGKPILIQIKSKDVIHGFFVPNARIQIDAIPGQVSKLWFDANKPGHYEIACFHLCGTAHYKMKAFLDVMTESDFKLWQEENSAWAAAKFDPADKAVQWGWEWGMN
ncbi:MAG: cytochrome c oxidase subunit II [Bdellovibrionales bacterium]|nr:cytochrome c oxidase subunit II [Bdellovibrionales bacterium]